MAAFRQSVFGIENSVYKQVWLLNCPVQITEVVWIMFVWTNNQSRTFFIIYFLIISFCSNMFECMKRHRLWVVQQVITVLQHDCKLTNEAAQQCSCADWDLKLLAIILCCETQLPVETDRVAWLPWTQKRELAVILFAPAFGLAKFFRPLVVGEIHHLLDFLLIFDL